MPKLSSHHQSHRTEGSGLGVEVSRGGGLRPGGSAGGLTLDEAKWITGLLLVSTESAANQFTV